VSISLVLVRSTLFDLCVSFFECSNNFYTFIHTPQKHARCLFVYRQRQTPTRSPQTFMTCFISSSTTEANCAFFAEWLGINAWNTCTRAECVLGLSKAGYANIALPKCRSSLAGNSLINATTVNRYRGKCWSHSTVKWTSCISLRSPELDCDSGVSEGKISRGVWNHHPLRRRKTSVDNGSRVNAAHYW
jgi:hypothetical protein